MTGLHVSKKPKKGYSAVAGILDCFGGLRFVVADEWRIHVFHVNPERDEKAFVVPGFYIKEPVPWDYIPVLVRRVELYVRWWIDTRNDPDDINDYRLFMYLRRSAVTGRAPAALHIPEEMLQ